MQLTSAQLATLKADISTNAALAAARSASNWAAVADFYNQPSTFIVWKTSVSVTDMQGAYVWSELDTLTVAKFQQLLLLTQPGSINPSLPNVRVGVQGVFSLSTTPNTMAALVALAKRTATNGEKLFATGTGTNGSPGTMQAEGQMTERDVTLAINS